MIADTQASVVLVILHDMLRHGFVIYIFNKVEYLGRNKVTKFYQRSYIVILTDLPNAISKMLDKISFHKHIKIQ